MKKLLKYIAVSALLVLLLLFVVDYYVQKTVESQLYDDVTTIPHNKVGLLLGTSKYVGHGRENLYYRYRINAAAALYKAGKIDYILISGDNGHKGYNEPEDMKRDLMAQGVPADHIALDYAGFRTLDSIVRCNKVFGEQDITIISQKFHNERSVYLANHKGVHAIACNAQNVPKKWQIKVMIREKFARVKMLLDLLLHKEPRFYGAPLTIENAAKEPLHDVQ